MPIAKPFIDTPTDVRWLGDRMEITAKSGDLDLSCVMSRHAAVALLKGLQREIARSEEIGHQELFERLARK